MSYHYFNQALAQHLLYQMNIKKLDELKTEIAQLKQAIGSKQKKHRRCDKQLVKSFNCPSCQKVYASDVSLKLHLKIKHLEKQSVNQKTNEKIPEQDKQCNTEQFVEYRV